MEENIQFTKAAGGGIIAGQAVHACQKALNRGLISGGPEDDLIRIIKAEGDHIAVLQGAIFDLFPVDENSAAVAAIFEIISVRLAYEGGTLARDARVGELEVVPSVATAADEKRRFTDLNTAARAIRRNDLKLDRFRGWGIRHHNHELAGL